MKRSKNQKSIFTPNQSHFLFHEIYLRIEFSRQIKANIISRKKLKITWRLASKSYFSRQIKVVQQ